MKNVKDTGPKCHWKYSTPRSQRTPKLTLVQSQITLLERRPMSPYRLLYFSEPESKYITKQNQQLLKGEHYGMYTIQYL